MRDFKSFESIRSELFGEKRLNTIKIAIYFLELISRIPKILIETRSGQSILDAKKRTIISR
jgi:hypothetical protein